MSRGYLSGAEPEEKEEKTEAQLNDEQQASFMSASNELFQAAETDDTPAIERSNVHKGEILAEAHNAKPGFKIDSDFEREMKEREAKEQAEREKRRQAEEEQAAAEAKVRQERVERQLKKAQSLDPEEIQEKLAEENRRSNENKLYPDAKPIASDVEEALWQKRKNDPGSAKIVDYVDEKLAGTLNMAIACEIVAAILYLLPEFIKFNSVLEFLKNIIYVSVAALVVASGVLLYTGGSNTRHKTIPSDQKNKFLILSIVPGLGVRMVCIGVFSALFAMMPASIASILATVAGAAIGASIHYSFLNHFDIYVSTITTILNSLAYGIIIILPQILSITLDPTAPAAFIGFLYTTLLTVFVFFLADRVAMTLALKTNK